MSRQEKDPQARTATHQRRGNVRNRITATVVAGALGAGAMVGASVATGAQKAPGPNVEMAKPGTGETSKKAEVRAKRVKAAIRATKAFGVAVSPNRYVQENPGSVAPNAGYAFAWSTIVPNKKEGGFGVRYGAVRTSFENGKLNTLAFAHTDPRPDTQPQPEFMQTVNDSNAIFNAPFAGFGKKGLQDDSAILKVKRDKKGGFLVDYSDRNIVIGEDGTITSAVSGTSTSPVVRLAPVAQIPRLSNSQLDLQTSYMRAMTQEVNSAYALFEASQNSGPVEIPPVPMPTVEIGR